MEQNINDAFSRYVDNVNEYIDKNLNPYDPNNKELINILLDGVEFANRFKLGHNTITTNEKQNNLIKK